MSAYVIVGGVAGGATAAARLRRQDEEANIIVLERGPYVSFANCGLPYYMGGVISERDALLVSTPEKLKAEFNIDVRPRHEVLRVDRQAKEVEVRDLENGQTYRLAYDKLLLSPGAKPLVPPIPGVNQPGVFTLRNIPDVDAIVAYLKDHPVKHAVVVGGGFIGLEMAENLVQRGVRVTIAEMMSQVMINFDFEMAALLHRHLRDKGVQLALGDGLKQIDGLDGQRLRVTLVSGKSTEAEIVVLAIGVRPENDLAKAAGLTLGPRGHIVVSRCMQTSDPDIYAVGDAVQVTNPITGESTAVPLAGPANRQARIAADHMSGADSTCEYRGTQGTSIVKVFDMTAASTGLNSKGLTSVGIPFLSSITHSPDHVAYYPGSTTQSVKLFYAPGTGKILGAQVVGYNAVDRTINALAMAIYGGMTVFDLEKAELAYAPPYGAAKDVVNVAGYVAGNRLRGSTDMIEWQDLAEHRERYTVVDVRTVPEWTAGHIKDALHIPNVELRGRLAELPKDKELVVYCKVGRRGYVMERVLKQHGYNVRNLSGGWTTYEAATEPQSNFEPEEPGSRHAEGSTPAAAMPPTASDSAAKQDSSAMALRLGTPSASTVYKLDAKGLQCPGPLMAVYKKMQEMDAGDVLEVEATDPGFRRDVVAWASSTGTALVELTQVQGLIHAVLRKGAAEGETTPAQAAAPTKAKTIVVFSGDLDHAIAAFFIANGAASMGQQVTMFFTFWGLNMLRKEDAGPVSKNLTERMFDSALPKGADDLKLSQLHMAGLGTRMMKKIMQDRNIDSLPELIKSAQAMGVRLIACQTTMDLMGIRAEELLDGVEVGGVATFINATDQANASLFI
jgi:NADPH-dependent 2,4-dienoyl-CoA reductase/sulfur reductase-like enzyme/peroxiredoxin family protein/rhodanese-related sulfurtransferase/TusA-related sulfurtransferase